MRRLLMLLALSVLVQPVRAAEVAAVHSKLYVLHSASDEMSVIDVASQTVLKTVRVGARPHGIAAPASQRVLYVSSEDDASVAEVDTLKDEVLDTYRGFGRQPNEIDVTSDGRYLYVPARGDGVYEVFDTREKRIIARIPTDGLPHNVVVAPDDRYVYLAPMEMPDHRREELTAKGFPTSLNRKIYVVDARDFTVVGTVPTAQAPRPVAVSPDGHYLYVNTNDLMGFLVLDLDARRVQSRAEYALTPRETLQPSRSHGIAVTPDQREVWSTDVNHALVFVFDVTANPPRQIARLPTGRSPLWLTMSRDGKTAYVANTADDSVSAFDVAAKAERGRIALPAGAAPTRMLVLDVPARSAP